MKMVKSLLLGSAAGLVAVTAGQAADLPVKAKPVEYVKVCSLYGAGFYYMPGTEMCIKIGGWVRAEGTDGGSGSLTWGPYNGNTQLRTTNNLALRARGYITADAREQTAYGTARAYIAVGISESDTGLQTSTPASTATTFSANRAFLQFAGFTGGLTLSFYDFYSGPATSFRSGYFPNSDTGDGSWLVFGYTAQLGNGFSGTIAAEQRRVTQIIDTNALPGPAGTVPLAGGGTVIPGAFPCTSTIGGAVAPETAGSTLAGCSGIFPGDGAYGGLQVPDFVANIRLDQAWGGGQIMGALHEVNANYYSSANALQSAPGTSGASGTGHPGDTWGFAAGVGLRINFPMIAKGDYFQSQFNYTQGALRYLFQTPNTNWGEVNGSSEAYGVLSDCVYGGTVGVGNNTSCQLTTAWGVNVAYEHYWTPAWHESVIGAYYQVDYNTLANAQLCASTGHGNALGGSLAVAGAGCNNNWSTWAVGSRLQWDVTKSFYLGVEALYEDLHSAQTGAAGGAVTSPAGFATYAFGGATVNAANINNWAFTFRAHKDFLP